ncbi:uncharacterized protein M6B38_160685 [Iris pallida]|uniref:Uncharacterized protein n=1 Tax=Iris pallida TaxID=29817 RepID=A0AAX6EZF3_IRIPA|nr:uncharacterized protein M6B38_160685 [Iris pallida]
MRFGYWHSHRKVDGKLKEVRWKFLLYTQHCISDVFFFSSVKKGRGNQVPNCIDSKSSKVVNIFKLTCLKCKCVHFSTAHL